MGVRRYANLRDTPEALTSGVWAIIGEFGGPIHAWEAAVVHPCEGVCVIPLMGTRTRPEGWTVPAADSWESSLTENGFHRRVEKIQQLIRTGELEQVNLCRVLSTPTPRPPAAKVIHDRLTARHPAPHSGWFDFPGAPRSSDPQSSDLGSNGPDRGGCGARGFAAGAWLVSASPELSLRVAGGNVRSSPIKGTARTREELLEKDYVENRLVTQALRQYLQEVCTDVRETRSCAVEDHPGLVQLVSTVDGRLRRDPAKDVAAWREILALLDPPLSVAGVPKHSALRTIAATEPTARGPYCGSSGWIDVDTGSCALGVTIRSFWWEAGRLKFGTGAGITSGSSPAIEWDETELKAQRLLQILATHSPPETSPTVD